MFMKKDLIKILFIFIFFCLIFLGCKKDNKGANDSDRKSGKNNVGVFTLTGMPIGHEGKFVLLCDGILPVGIYECVDFSFFPDDYVTDNKKFDEFINSYEFDLVYRTHLIGVEKINSLTNFNVVLPKISNGEVNIPLWNINDNSRYSGNNSFNSLNLYFSEKPNLVDYEDFLALMFNKETERVILPAIITGITFVNGTAVRNWTDFQHF